MPETILITGAGGCIGAWAVKLAREEGVPVVAFDMSPDKKRLELLYDNPEDANTVLWETGDIADAARVGEVFAKHRPQTVLHLAALQVPFCKESPANGARANVLGTINVFEAARKNGARNIAYASSVAASAMGREQWLETLYGAYKICNEQTARVYWKDWKVPSIGIRPSVVYGPARDQGMSAAPTNAMLAAILQKPFTVPFRGPAGYVYAAEAAAAFLRAAQKENPEGANVFDLNGEQKNTEDIVEMIRARAPGASIRCEGDPLPFPSDMSDAPLRNHIGNYPRPPSLAEGIQMTMDFFTRRKKEGRLTVIPAKAGIHTEPAEKQNPPRAKITANLKQINPPPISDGGGWGGATQ